MLSPRRSGFTALELLVVLAVLAILAAVVGRNVVGTVNTGRAAGLAESLDALRQSVYAYRGDVRRYPTTLSQLATQPSTATDLCGRDVPAAFLAEWRGPYTSQPVTTNGVSVGDALILDALEGPTGQGIEASGALLIVVENVDSVLAARLERSHDAEPIAAGAYADGVIRWSDSGVVGDGRGTLKFGLPIRGC